MTNNINELIINWYDTNKRDLPWRKTRDPYKIWLSEIILQQTRVQQGTAYYMKFIHNFATVKSLAKADEQLVLQLWQGLGYYSRARNLHKTAKIISTEKGGIFPNSYAEIRKLPGIGDYTASAISSFAFDEAQAVLDGNVFRVLSRIFDWATPIDSVLGKKEFRHLAQEFLFKKDPAKHNQAVMEFGALLCTPKNPGCAICPILQHCASHKNKTIAERPTKAKKTAVRNRYFHFIYLEFDDQILVKKRTDKDIWQHLFQLPLLELMEDEGFQPETIGKVFNFDCQLYSEKGKIQHLLSHQRLNIQFHSAQLAKKIAITDHKWIKISDVGNYPFPKPLVDFLSRKIRN